MSKPRVFLSVSPSALARIRAVGVEHGVAFEPPDAALGVATGRTPFGECRVAFAHDPSAGTLTLEVRRKPMLLPNEAVWRTLEGVIEEARAQADS